ncbi:MAG: hypothetical protein JXP37_09060 [Coriobacteriia bacterium]|nr:hypothetical protein [Coriobacteriia bacterium]
MMHHKPDDERLGMRLHEVNRQRAVDRAVERMRHGLRADWDYLTADDHSNLRWVVGELWETSSREQWDSLHFSKLALQDVRRLVGIGDRLRRHGTNRASALEGAYAIVHEARAVANECRGAESASLAY